LFLKVSLSKSAILSCFKLLQSPVPTLTQSQLSTAGHLKRSTKTRILKTKKTCQKPLKPLKPKKAIFKKNLRLFSPAVSI